MLQCTTMGSKYQDEMLHCVQTVSHNYGLAYQADSNSHRSILSGSQWLAHHIPLHSSSPSPPP